MVTPDPASADRSEPGYTFDFCGGQLAIDFTNTVGDRGDAPEEHFHTFGDIVAWAEARGVLARSEAARLRRDAAGNRDAARRAVADALALRESLYRLLYAVADGKTPRSEDLARVNAAVADTFSSAALVRGGDGFVLETPGRGGLLEPILRPVVRAAVDLLTSERLHHVGRCADDTCRWLFLDTTRSKTRRWCDMKSCGNRNKVRRFRGET